MDKSRRDGKSAVAGVGIGGKLRQRLSQMLLHSSCATTSATAFVSLAKPNAAAVAAASRQAPPLAGAGAVAANELQRPKIDGGVRRRRRRSARASSMVHISINCSGPTGDRHSARSPLSPAKDVKALKSKCRGGRRPARSPSTYGCSSSTDTDEGGETTARSSALFSSLSISSDSTTSDFYNTGGSKRHPPRRAAPPPARQKQNDGGGVDDRGAKRGGGVAVVKRSQNPYADFRRSMVEMVVERGICGGDAMADLLVSYLSLNSRRHHPAILAAFQDVWEAVFATP